MNEQKSINFYNLIKSLGYTNINNYSPKSFEYLFGIADTKDFFDWFLANANSDCFLSSDEIINFQEKAKKSQVILNIDKLRVLCSINSNGDNITNNFQTVEDYKKSIEQKEAEFSLLQKKISFRQAQKQSLIDELNEMKSKKKQQFEKTQHELNLKQIYIKNMFKSLNTQFKSLIKMLNNELSVNGTFSNKIQEISKTDIENVVSNEEQYIDMIRNLINTSNIFDTNDNTNDDFRSQILLYEYFYPKLVLKWFNAKCEKSMQQSQLNELVKFHKTMLAYLVNKNNGDFDNLNEKTKYLSMNLKIILENCEKIGTKIAFSVKQLTS